MACGDMPHLVPDDIAQRLGVTGFTANLEHVGVYANVAAEPVAGGEGVKRAVAANNVGVGDAAQAGGTGGLNDHLVPLRELGGRHADAAHALLCVEYGTRNVDEQRPQHQQHHELLEVLLHVVFGGSGTRVITEIPQGVPAVYHEQEGFDNENDQTNVRDEGKRVGGNEPGQLTGVPQTVDSLIRQQALKSPEFRGG